MPKRFPIEQRERITRMALERLAEYPSPYACAKELAPKLGLTVETLRKWLIQAQVDAGDRQCPTSTELEEIRKLKAEVRDLREANEILRAAPVFFARELDPRQPLICSFIDEQRALGHGVESICAVLREQGLPVAPRTYRSWKAGPPGGAVAGRTVTDAMIVDLLRGLATAGPRGGSAPEIMYGRRKMTAWLARTLSASSTAIESSVPASGWDGADASARNGVQGPRGLEGVSKHTVDRLMRQEGMYGLRRSRGVRTTIPAAKDARRAADLLKRCFSAPAPNRAWVTDFTYVPTWSGFVYTALVIDLYSRAIVGWSTSSVKDVAFVESALKMALWRRDHAGRPVTPGMIHHSDAGSQYTSIRYTET